MNRDDITYSVPAYENEADRYAADESPIRLGETGAGLGWGEGVHRLAETAPAGFPNGCLTAQTRGTKCGYGHECVPA